MNGGPVGCTDVMFWKAEAQEKDVVRVLPEEPRVVNVVWDPWWILALCIRGRCGQGHPRGLDVTLSNMWQTFQLISHGNLQPRPTIGERKEQGPGDSLHPLPRGPLRFSERRSPDGEERSLPKSKDSSGTWLS
ncbi:hypothetical protein NDU88_006061 [Pleurodeles waltl]|uniref:Uncharacterized protein n=1 Tax=Pleurodeles waltl TaxID=8319 RepID=A0AAV7UKF7_PLEWA|nr:hypothetical protein NDU88_006061 [Pleurodeles waltl]